MSTGRLSYEFTSAVIIPGDWQCVESLQELFTLRCHQYRYFRPSSLARCSSCLIDYFAIVNVVSALFYKINCDATKVISHDRNITKISHFKNWNDILLMYDSWYNYSGLYHFSLGLYIDTILFRNIFFRIIWFQFIWFRRQAQYKLNNSDQFILPRHDGINQ